MRNKSVLTLSLMHIFIFVSIAHAMNSRDDEEGSSFSFAEDEIDIADLSDRIADAEESEDNLLVAFQTFLYHQDFNRYVENWLENSIEHNRVVLFGDILDQLTTVSSKTLIKTLQPKLSVFFNKIVNARKIPKVIFGENLFVDTAGVMNLVGLLDKNDPPCKLQYSSVEKLTRDFEKYIENKEFSDATLISLCKHYVPNKDNLKLITEASTDESQNYFYRVSLMASINAKRLALMQSLLPHVDELPSGAMQSLISADGKHLYQAILDANDLPKRDRFLASIDEFKEQSRRMENAPFYVDLVQNLLSPKSNDDAFAIVESLDEEGLEDLIEVHDKREPDTSFHGRAGFIVKLLEKDLVDVAELLHKGLTYMPKDLYLYIIRQEDIGFVSFFLSPERSSAWTNLRELNERSNLGYRSPHRMSQHLQMLTLAAPQIYSFNFQANSLQQMPAIISEWLGSDTAYLDAERILFISDYLKNAHYDRELWSPSSEKEYKSLDLQFDDKVLTVCAREHDALPKENGDIVPTNQSFKCWTEILCARRQNARYSGCVEQETRFKKIFRDHIESAFPFYELQIKSNEELDDDQFKVLHESLADGRFILTYSGGDSVVENHMKKFMLGLHDRMIASSHKRLEKIFKSPTREELLSLNSMLKRNGPIVEALEESAGTRGEQYDSLRHKLHGKAADYYARYWYRLKAVSKESILEVMPGELLFLVGQTLFVQNRLSFMLFCQPCHAKEYDVREITRNILNF